MNEKPLFLSLGFPGVLGVGRHGQRLGLWDLQILDPERTNEIPTRDVYILGAFSDFYKPLLEHAPGKIVVLWTSSGGEVGFEPIEQEQLRYIMDEPAVSAVWFGHRGLAQTLGGKGFYAPYPICFGQAKVYPKLEIEGTMTLFCPQTLKKNLYNQCLAASLIQKATNLTLETNILVPEAIKPHLRHRAYDWLPEEKYRPILEASSLSLCASWAETLSYFSLESAMAGVPVVGSHAIPWLPDWAQAHPDDPLNIAKRGGEILWMGMPAVAEQKKAAESWAKSANDELRTALDRHLHSLSE